MDIAEQTGCVRSQGRAYGNLGLTYEALGNHERAVVFQEQHLSVAAQTNDLIAKTLAYGSLGRTHHALQNYAQAVMYLQEGKTLICLMLFFYLVFLLKVLKKKVEARLSHREHSSLNASPVVPPLLPRLCDITLHHRVTHLHNLCLLRMIYHSCSVVVSGAGSGVCELTNQSRLCIQEAGPYRQSRARFRALASL